MSSSFHILPSYLLSPTRVVLFSVLWLIDQVFSLVVMAQGLEVQSSSKISPHGLCQLSRHMSSRTCPYCSTHRWNLQVTPQLERWLLWHDNTEYLINPKLHKHMYACSDQGCTCRNYVVLHMHPLHFTSPCTTSIPFYFPLTCSLS